MGLMVQDGGGERYLPPQDSYVARCVGVVDLGTQPSKDYGPKRQVLLSFELCECEHVFDESVGPEPAVISRYFTASLNEKSNLRAFLEGWRSRGFTPEELDGFDLLNLLDVPAWLTVTHKTNGKGDQVAFISSATKMPAGAEVPPHRTPILEFSFDEPSQTHFDALPEWMRKQIAQSIEYGDWTNGGNAEPLQELPDVGDEIPF